MRVILIFLLFYSYVSFLSTRRYARQCLVLESGPWSTRSRIRTTGVQRQIIFIIIIIRRRENQIIIIFLVTSPSPLAQQNETINSNFISPRGMCQMERLLLIETIRLLEIKAAMSTTIHQTPAASLVSLGNLANLGVNRSSAIFVTKLAISPGIVVLVSHLSRQRRLLPTLPVSVTSRLPMHLMTVANDLRVGHVRVIIIIIIASTR